jgi:putative endopeptidase
MNYSRYLPAAAAWFVLAAGLNLTAAEPAQLPDPGFSTDKMDRSVDPRADFAQYAAGGWYARTEIPSDKSRWGGFGELDESNWIKLRAIVEETAANPGAPGSLTQKVGDFYASALDTATINARGLEPIQADLAAIAAASDAEQLITLAAQMHLKVGGPFLGLAFFADQKQSDRYGFYLFQGGMSLPSKEYYFSDKFARERWEFTGHVAKMFELAGDSRAVAYQKAEKVFALEKSMATNAKLPVELRDRMANYNKMTIADALAAYPGVPLARFIAELGIPSAVTEVIVGQPKFFEGLSQVMQDTPLDDLKTYVRWNLLRSAAPYLSEAFDQESFRFYGTVLSGTPQQEPRWQRATKVVDRSVGEALGQLYVAKHYPPEAKARMDEMIGNIMTVFRERLEKLE